MNIILSRITATVVAVIGVGAGLLTTAAPAHATPAPAGVVVVRADPTPVPAAPSTTPTPTTPTSPLPVTPAPTPAPSPSIPALADDPAWYDVPGQIRKGITDFLTWVASTGLTPVMAALGATVLATPDLTGNERVRVVHSTFQVIANSMLGLFVIAACYVLVTRESLQARYGVRELAPRLVLATFLVNFSLPICGMAIEFANALTAGIVGQGVDGPAAAHALQQAITGGVNPGTAAPTGGFLVALMVLAALVMAVIVVILFFLRLAMLLLLIGTAPLALMGHALPQTDGLAMMWWRAFFAVLGIQIGQAAVLLATVRVFLTPGGIVISGIPASVSGLVGVCMAIAMLWLMIKIPSWLKGFVLGPHQGRGVIRSILGTIITIKSLGLAAGLISSTRKPSSARGQAAPMPVAPVRPTTPTRITPRPNSFPATAVKPQARPGPAAFSHAPPTHTPLPKPAGSVGPQFSHPDRPTPTVPGRAGSVGIGFSHTPPAAAPMPNPGRAPASRPRFSDPAPTPRPRPHTPTPSAPPKPATAAVAYSNPVVPQAAPARPPAPVTPVFSHPTPPVAPQSSRKTKEKPS